MGAVTRQRAVQGPPPDDLDQFPVRSHDGAFYRVAKFGPWWFCRCGGCRFDLMGVGDASRGTLYAGTNPITGVLETIGPEMVGRTVSSEFFRDRTVWVLAYDRALKLADLCHGSAVGFGVTNELSIMTPYEMPQAWAVALDADGWDGIAYRTRFSTGTAVTGLALFDTAGEHDWPRQEHLPADSPEIRAELARLGIDVVDGPCSSADFEELT